MRVSSYWNLILANKNASSTLFNRNSVFIMGLNSVKKSHDSIRCHSQHSHSKNDLLGHSHTHSIQNNVFLQESGGWKNPGIRITCIGLAVNVTMAVGKAIGGIVFNSQALLADSVHALSDLVSDFLTLATVSISTRPPSKYFPLGYGKVETMGSFGVSALLLLAGVSMGWGGLVSMIHHSFGDNAFVEFFGFMGHSNVGSDEPAQLNAAWLALASIGVKEWLYAATMKVAKQTNSNVLAANAWHHRIDSLVSMVAVASIGGGHYLDIAWLDPLGGIIVSSVIAKAGYGSAKQAVLELLDCNEQMSTKEDGESPLDAHRAMVLDQLKEIKNARPELETFHLSDIRLMPSGSNKSSLIILKPGNKSSPIEDFAILSTLLKKQLTQNDRSLRKIEITVTPSITPTTTL